MWSPPAVCMVCILFGITCDVKLVYSQTKSTQTNSAQIPDEANKLNEDIQKFIDQIHSLSSQPENTQHSFTGSSTGDSFFTGYYSVLNNLYTIFQPLLTEKFINDLPKTVVCLLSGRQDCGLEAVLTKAVSLQLGKPLLTLVSSLRSQTCPPLNTESQTNSFFGSYRTAQSTTTTTSDGFQFTLMNILSSIPLSGNLMNDVNNLLDSVVVYVLKFLASFLQVPMDYIKIALQFGIRIPSLDGEETCEEGDLKQLIMWGINNNVSWSFANTLVDILLETFLPSDQSLCTYPGPECQNPSTIPFQRSIFQAQNDTNANQGILLNCDRHDLARFNDTLCADILMGSNVASTVSVLTFCQALSSLSPAQIEEVWRNMCYGIQAMTSPLLTMSADCSVGDSLPAPAVMPAVTAASKTRVVREASNLKQLACNYSSWLGSRVVDPVLVTLCSDNEREVFVQQVCNNALLMRKLLSDQTNNWLYMFCANSSADHDNMVSKFCVYEQWISQPMVTVDSSLLEFCMILDGPRLNELICQHTGFFTLLFSNPDNFHFIPNCTNVSTPPPFLDIDLFVLDSCHYSEWHDLKQITSDILLQCIRIDQSGFAMEVCTNSTFLNSLLQNKANYWLEEHCNSTLISLPPESIQPFRVSDWCDYQTWGSRQVDNSVIGFCWQQDQLAFRKNICCNASLFDKLLQDPSNQWLVSVCTDTVGKEVLPQVCRYADWTRPIIVDMTELALCAEIDALNFTSKVCTNDTVLQNLLANPDNTWLIQHCANSSKPTVSPSVGAGVQGGGLTGFKPADQCQYLSWSVSLPDVTLLTLCWEHDQTSFVSSVCPNAAVLFMLSQEPFSKWVSHMCTTFTNHTTTTTGTNNTSTTANVCLARSVVRHFNWTCSADFNSACQPGASQNIALQMLFRCWADSMKSKLEDLFTAPVATVLEEAISTTVVILLALEEVQNTSLHITENIRLSVLASVVRYLENEDNFSKKRVVLQCFGRVLTSLMQTTRDLTNDEFFVIKEYFNVPLSSLRPVLSSAHITTIRLILQYYSTNKDTLQLSDEYLSTMVSVLLQTQLVKDGTLFLDLTPLLTVASSSDIQAMPSLQNNINVKETINRNLGSLTVDQREAFALWYSKVLSPSNITTGDQSLIRDTGNLIAYLPFYNFQHLTSAQLLDGLEVLQRNTLTFLKQEFVAQSIIGVYKNLSAADFVSLGDLTCLADPKDLLIYKNTEAFSVIQDIVMNCSRKGLSLPSSLISNMLLNSMEISNPSSLSPDQITRLAHLLPVLGVTFLQGLTPSQLLAALPALSSVSFSPEQASIIIDKLAVLTTLTAPGQLQKLGSLIVGMRTESFLNLTSDRLLSSLPAMAQHTPGLSMPQATAIATKLWGFSEVVGWLDDVDPLLYSTPLVSVLPRTQLLVNNITTTSTKHWNTQQAKAIFRVVLNTKPNLVKLNFLSLGTLVQGVSCSVLQDRIEADSSLSALRKILTVLSQQPARLHTSLKKCVIDELYQFDFFPALLKNLGAEISLSIPVSTIKKFNKDMMDTLRKTVIQDPRHFLLLPTTKQELLVDKIVQRMGIYTGVFTEEEFRSLGIMAPFVVDEVFNQMDRSFFSENLDFLRGLCYSGAKMDIVARILQEPATFGPVKNWNQTTLNQVDWFVFFLPTDKLQEIPQALMTVGRIERLFMSQRQWERGEVGSHCWDENEKTIVFVKQQFVLQFFLGFLKITPQSRVPIIPTCEILQTTNPAAWTSASLTSMSSSAFNNCLELMGQDQFLASYQRSQVLKKVKQMFGPVSSLSQSVISQMGVIALELTPDELSSLRLAERRSIAAMGAIGAWNSRQLATLFTSVLNSTKQNPSQLDSSTLVAMGYIVCGAKSTDMSSFNAVEFSKAALWLGQLALNCSEEQLVALVGLLTNSLAFGAISSWGTDVFIEIGVLAAGLPDMAMTSLVKEQIEGITPGAISLIPPNKFGVVFSHRQISMFSYEQATAVTEKQLAALSDIQKTALALVLTPWEDRVVDFRVGRSVGLALSHSPECLILGLLMLLIVLPRADPVGAGT